MALFSTEQQILGSEYIPNEIIVAVIDAEFVNHMFIRFDSSLFTNQQ